MLELAQQYAQLKGTQVIAHAFKDDGSITFVLESGSKLNMTEAQLTDAIKSAQTSEPFAYIEQELAVPKSEAKTKPPTKAKSKK